MPVNNFYSRCSLGSSAQPGTKHIGLKKDVFANGVNIERPEPQGSAPVKPRAFYDGAAGAREARRNKEGNRVHPTRRDEGAVDATAALDQKRLHPAFRQGAQQMGNRDAAGAVSRQKKNLGPGPAQGPLAGQPSACVAGARAWLRSDDKRRGRAQLPDESG